MKKKSYVSKSYDNLHDNEIIWIEYFFSVKLLCLQLLSVFKN